MSYSYTGSRASHYKRIMLEPLFWLKVSFIDTNFVQTIQVLAGQVDRPLKVVVESWHAVAVVFAEVEGRGVVVGEVGELVWWEQYEPDEFVEQVHVREQSVSRSKH